MASTSGSAPILDLYAPLRHKAVMQSTGLGRIGLAPSWVPEDAGVRLTAYKVLKAMEQNSARGFLPEGTSQATADAMREYGDAALIAYATRAGVIGSEPEIVVDGADVDLPDAPDFPPPPEQPTAPAEGETDPSYPFRLRAYQGQVDRWEEAAETAVTDWEQAWADLPGLQARQDWLRDWATSEGFWSKLHECEGDAVTLGDGVLTLSWSERKQRPILRVYDPGFYFPVLDEQGADEGFPRKVHLAWELERVDPQGRKRKVLRRLTWELGETPDGEARRYPWHGEDDEPSTETCYFSDGEWELSATSGVTGLADLGDTGVTWLTNEDGVEANRLDLGVDFIPVVHVPNTPASREHFGASVLLGLAQLLDDVHLADSDLRKSSSLAAGPAVAFIGLDPSGDPIFIKPGVGFRIPKDGDMKVLDMTAGLPELRQNSAALRDLLSVNGRVPGVALGRIDPGQAPSGIALAILLSPFAQLIGELRLTRDRKYELLNTMNQRLAQVGGVLEPGPNPTARVAFGAFMVSDRSAAVADVARLLEAGAISTQTAVNALVVAGLSIPDAKHEVDRIRLDRPEAARVIADATGSEELAAEHLGLDLPEPVQAEPVAPPRTTLPGVPETGTQAGETEGQQ